MGDAFIALPVGIGTLDEISEVIVMAALGKHQKPCILYNKNGYYNLLRGMFDQMTEFDFMTRDEVQKKIQEAFSNTGVDGDFNYKIYALDHETLSEYEYHNNHDGSEARDKYKDAWTKDDDAYYVCARQTYDGVPVFHMFLGAFAEEEDDKTPITAIISSSGFLY